MADVVSDEKSAGKDHAKVNLELFAVPNVLESLHQQQIVYVKVYSEQDHKDRDDHLMHGRIVTGAGI